MAHVMLKVLYDNAVDVPRSITVKSCHSMDGAGRSWTFPVYMLRNELADRFPLDEDDLPPNGGNPHPFNDDVFPGEPGWVQHWVNEQMLQGAFLVDFAPEEHPHMAQVLNLHAEAEEAWEAWPAPPFPTPAAEQQQEVISVQMSVVSNQQTMQGPPTADPTRLELPANPTIEDFAQTSVVAQVMTDELLWDPTVDTQIVPVTDIPTVGNAAT
ncbi:hypothetical protein GUJ93_ZPchr0004g39501 [Zizania palustris]|uniref:Uncharacterized protein n=1 Tax=Zizania palustris TaxID=103762 RepID=A0A8J5VYR6_ZIZPA|nr:hypothetical protein GUJ93_ZPchr0004g39501 [Zizania palustris]